MNTFTNEERMMIMQQAINNVENELVKTGYIKNISSQEFDAIVIGEFHRLIRDLLYKRANKIG